MSFVLISPINRIASDITIIPRWYIRGLTPNAGRESDGTNCRTWKTTTVITRKRLLLAGQAKTWKTVG